MVALQSIRPAVSSIARNPLLLVITAAYGLLQLPQFVGQSLSPLAGAAVSLAMTGVILVTLPFYQGGLLAMADEARTGSTALATFITAGKSNYLALLLAYLVLIAVATVFFIIGIVVAIFGGISVLAAGEPNTALLVIVGLLGALATLAYLLAIFLIQFYGHAIVLSDSDVIESFRHSISLVRTNLVTVLGYSIIIGVGGVVLGLFASVASIVFAPENPLGSVLPELSVAIFLVAGVVYLVSTALLGAFYATYSVCVYRELEPTQTAAGDPPVDDTAAGDPPADRDSDTTSFGDRSDRSPSDPAGSSS